MNPISLIEQLFHVLIFSLGSYAKMIKDGLEKTIAEGQV